MTQCVGISCVRNESDIIELAVRYNLRLLDELHVIDNLSTDRTRWVLEQLRGEGLPVHIHEADDPDFRQERLVSRLARELVGRAEVDFVVPLDADELLEAPGRPEFHTALAAIPRGSAGAMLWKTFLPETGGDERQAYFRRMTRYRSHEDKRLNKLILRGRMCSVYSWTSGCHNAFHDETRQPIPRVDLPFRLAHYPIRGAIQLAKKIVVGAHALSIKENRFEGEGAHWLDLARQLRESGYDAATFDLTEIALRYPLKAQPEIQQQIHQGAVPDFPQVQQRYPVEPVSLIEVVGDCLNSSAATIQARKRVLSGFTSDRFSQHIPNWRYWMTGLKDVPSARFLEIGAFEGRATVWLLTHALTRPDARVYCVDTFGGGPDAGEAHSADLLLRFRANVAPWKDKVVECIGDPAQVLPQLKESFDAVSIGGPRAALDYLRDAVHSWASLKAGGVMVLDNYRLEEHADPSLLPATAIDGFLACVANRYRLLHKGAQVAIQKL